MKTIDALGLACPTPVILSKKEIDAGAVEFTILVDNDIAVSNLRKLASSQGFGFSVTGGGDRFEVQFSGGSGEAAQPEVKSATAPQGNGYSVFVGKEYIGDGDRELGLNLMRMFFFTLSEGDDIPASVLFMNGGVKLTCGDEQVVQHLQNLQSRGCEVLVCGTCLSFFGIAEELKIGEVSNMYDIAQRMLAADKVITL